MAHFRGIISGKVVVHLYEQDGIDFARVSLQTRCGRGTSQLIYDRPVGGECVWDTTERKARGVAWSPTWSAV